MDLNYLNLQSEKVVSIVDTSVLSKKITLNCLSLLTINTDYYNELPIPELLLNMIIMNS